MVLAVVNDAAANMIVQIFVQVPAFCSAFGCLPRSGIPGSNGDSLFNFLRNHHTVFHTDCTILQFYQQCKRVSFALNPCQHFLAF